LEQNNSSIVPSCSSKLDGQERTTKDISILAVSVVPQTNTFLVDVEDRPIFMAALKFMELGYLVKRSGEAKSCF
jgi:hypothetical protein